jgi:hypothetical protein
MSSSEAIELLSKGAALDDIGIGQYSSTGSDIKFKIHFPGRAISHAGQILDSALLVHVQVQGSDPSFAPVNLKFGNPVVSPALPLGVKWPFFIEEGDFPALRIVDRGRPMTFSCDPRGLDSSRRNIPGAPHWATEVYFSARVLDRYQDQKSPYAILPDPAAHDSFSLVDKERNWVGELIRRGDVVEAQLGVIGEFREAERLHWAQHNVQSV